MILELVLDKKNMTLDDLNELAKVELTYHDPKLLTDGIDWCFALNSHSKSNIVIYGDYDPDGVCGDAILAASLDIFKVGNTVNVYPADPKLGYGLSIQAVDDILALYPDTNLIITNDNGIACKEAVDYAATKRIDVLVSDHHPSNDESLFPDKALAVVNINRTDKIEKYPFRGLSGTGTTWKLMLTYAQLFSNDDNLRKVQMLVPLVALTVASDVMPLTDENKTIVDEGIKLLNNHNQEYMRLVNDDNVVYSNVIKGICELASLDDKITYSTFGWVMSPLLNAERRSLMTSSMTHNLFLTNETSLDDLHALKTDITKKRNFALAGLKSEIDESVTKSGAVFQVTSDVAGSAGVIASQIVNRLNVPVVVVSPTGAASGRSPKGYKLVDIFKSIESQGDTIITKYGGHDLAAGLHVDVTRIDDFARLFDDAAKDTKSDETMTVENDSPIVLTEVPTISDYMIFTSMLDLLNEADKFLMLDSITYSITVDTSKFEYRTMGADGSHLKLTDPLTKFSIIVWSFDNYSTALSKDTVEFVGQLSVNSYMGRSTLQMIVREVI